MTKENTINQAEEVARNMEKAFQDALRDRRKKNRKGDPENRLIDKILKEEKERLDPTGKVDEEEGILYVLKQKDKKDKK